MIQFEANTIAYIHKRLSTDLIKFFPQKPSVVLVDSTVAILTLSVLQLRVEIGRKKS